jgi:hypothetical protein
MWRFLAWFAVLCYSQLAWAELPTLRALTGDRKFTALVEQGRIALERNEPAKAIPALEEAYRYVQRPGLLYLLGRAALMENRHGRPATCTVVTSNRMGDDAEAEVKAEQSQLLSHPLTVGAELMVVGATGGIVTVDGRLVGALPLATAIQLEPVPIKWCWPKTGRVESQVSVLARRDSRGALYPQAAARGDHPDAGVCCCSSSQHLEPGFLANVRKNVSEAVTQQKAVLVARAASQLMNGDRELFDCLDQPSCQERSPGNPMRSTRYGCRSSLGPAALSVPELQAVAITSR